MFSAPCITVRQKASYVGNKKKVQRDSVGSCFPGNITFQDPTTPEKHSLATLAQVPTCTFILFQSSWERIVVYKHRDRAWWEFFPWLHGVVQLCTYRISPTSSMEYKNNVNWERHRGPGASIPWSVLTLPLGCLPSPLLYRTLFNSIWFFTF